MPAVTTVDWTAAQEAVRSAAQRGADLVRSIKRPNAPALGKWTVNDVAVHMSHAMDGVMGMAKGGGGVLGDIWTLSDLTEALVQGETERDPAKLADRIEASVDSFLSYMQSSGTDQARTWFLSDIEVPLSMLTCHVLNELTVHSYDIARAEGVPWKVPPAHAALIVNGFLFQVLSSLGTAMVNQATATGVRATFDVKVRGGGRCQITFDNGQMTAKQSAPTGPVDCHLSVDPVAFLLVAWGRISQTGPIAQGKLFAYGKKPWLGLKFRSLLKNP